VEKIKKDNNKKFERKWLVVYSKINMNNEYERELWNIEKEK
jgi:hypothetical protein